VRLAAILSGLFWVLLGSFLMGWGWFMRDLRYEVLGAVIVLDVNHSLRIASLRRDLGLKQ
jgi:hypothetical protein